MGDEGSVSMENRGEMIDQGRLYNNAARCRFRRTGWEMDFIQSGGWRRLFTFYSARE